MKEIKYVVPQGCILTSMCYFNIDLWELFSIMKGANNIINNIINVVENLGDSTRSICK